MEALAAGTACIATPLGVQGLDVEPGRHLLVAASAADFASAIVGALSDPEMREALGRAGREWALARGDDGARRERRERLDSIFRAVAGHWANGSFAAALGASAEEAAP